MNETHIEVVMGAMDLVVVDGSNLYNMVAKQLDWAGPGAKEYLRDWFDIDRFVMAAAGLDEPPTLGTVVFHSVNALGGGDTRLDQAETLVFWGRQGRNPNTSTMQVTLPGEQRETSEGKCPKCGDVLSMETRGEKGIDTSIVTYLFETASSWNSLCLVARDVDYAPAVEALRRRGKQVFIVATQNERVTALERVAQSVLTWPQAFLRDDVMVADVFKGGGAFDQIVDTVGAGQAFDIQFLGEQPNRGYRLKLDWIAIEPAQNAGNLRSHLPGALDVAPSQRSNGATSLLVELPGATWEMFGRILDGRRKQGEWVKKVKAPGR